MIITVIGYRDRWCVAGIAISLCFCSFRASTKLCMSEYNVIDARPNVAEESRSQLDAIRIMLSASDALNGVDFKPTYALVSTWFDSIAYPYNWYDMEGEDAPLSEVSR